MLTTLETGGGNNPNCREWKRVPAWLAAKEWKTGMEAERESEKGTPRVNSSPRYAWTEGLKGGKDEKGECVREGVQGEGRRRSEEEWRDRLSCQAAVNLHRRDVEAGDFFCTSPLICASDYLNWLEQS